MDDKWTMRGLDEGDPKRIKTAQELADCINGMGFLPLFRNAVPGFSVEEKVASQGWWTDDPAHDPWVWRMILADTHEFAYGKLFNHCAGFVSRAWFPRFACARRQGYDFDSRVDEGIAKKREADVMRAFEGANGLTLPEIRARTQLKKGMDAALMSLQQQTYLLVGGFTQKVNKKGEPYGWHVSIYQTPEAMWGRDYVASAYALGEERCQNEIRAHLHMLFPGADERQLIKLVV